MTQPIDPQVVVAYAEIIAKDASRCRSVSGAVTEHGPTPARCTLPPAHQGNHYYGMGAK